VKWASLYLLGEVKLIRLIKKTINIYIYIYMYIHIYIYSMKDNNMIIIEYRLIRLIRLIII
jgi:hypothetical protein